VKRLVIIVTLAILLAALVLLGSSDTDISVADTSVPSSEVASNMAKKGNSSASAVITITMYAVADE